MKIKLSKDFFNICFSSSVWLLMGDRLQHRVSDLLLHSFSAGFRCSVLFMLRVPRLTVALFHVCLWWVSGNSFVLTFTKEKKRNLCFCFLSPPPPFTKSHYTARFLSTLNFLMHHVLWLFLCMHSLVCMHSVDSMPVSYMHSCMTYTNHTGTLYPTMQCIWLDHLHERTRIDLIHYFTQNYVLSYKESRWALALWDTAIHAAYSVYCTFYAWRMSAYYAYYINIKDSIGSRASVCVHTRDSFYHELSIDSRWKSDLFLSTFVISHSP